MGLFRSAEGGSEDLMSTDDWKACRQDLEQLIASNSGQVRDQAGKIIERFKGSLDANGLGALEADLTREYDRIKPPAITKAIHLPDYSRRVAVLESAIDALKQPSKP
jgi:hypothetical protein